MTRRFGHGRRRTAAVVPDTPLDSALALSAGAPFFTMAGHVTLSGTGDVLSFHDLNDDGHVLTQSDTAKQVDPPAGHADFAGGLCATFTGAESYSTNTISKYTFTHDGSGATLVPVYTRTSTAGFHVLLASNLFISTTNRGIGIAGQAAGAIQAFVGSGTQTIWNTAAGGTTAAGVPVYCDVSWQKAADSWNVRKKGVSAASGTTPNTPNAAATITPMTLGAAANGTLGFVGRVAAFPCFPYVDASGRSTIQDWILQDYVIAP